MAAKTYNKYRSLQGGKSKRSIFPDEKEEEERGYFRQTVAELREETSAARNLMKTMKN